MASHDDQTWTRLGKGTLLTEDAKTGLGHIVSIEVYKAVYASLIALTMITVWAAFQDFGIFNLFIALGIATVKAGVVTLMFMHLNYEDKIVWGIVIYPLFIFVLILAGTLGDAAVKQVAPPPNLRPTAVEGAAAPAAAAEMDVVPNDGAGEVAH